MSVLHKARALLGDGGSWRKTAATAREVLHRVAAPTHEAVLLQVDLTDRRNRIGPTDADAGVRLARFDDRTLEDLTARTRQAEPAVPRRLRARRQQKVEGYAAYVTGQAVGSVFHVRGAHDPMRIVHPDLRWLGLRPTSDERYVFDYHVHPAHRTVGAAFLRAVHEALYRAGTQRAYGYVYARDEETQTLFQTTGWTEVGRVRERRLGSKVALVDGTFYWLNGTTRRPMWNR